MPRELEVDGVPTLLAPITGPMRAGLAFRVGWADETLSQHGITHLVEHLALHRQGVTDYHFNGATGPTVTQFVVQGSTERIIEYLHGVCESLTELPMQRLETEKEVLRTEAASRPPAALDQVQVWRYGARGYGLVSYPEWGTYRISTEEVLDWSRTWFTRENAVLWIAGDQIPAGLRLSLPGGQRQPLPEVSSALPVTPAYFNGAPSIIALDTSGARGVAAVGYTNVLERALFRRLRQEAGFSYTAGAAYRALDAERAVVAALADVAPHKEGEALRAFIETLRGLADDPVEENELAAVVTKTAESLGQPHAEAARLPGAAVNLLTGHPIRNVEQVRASWQALTPGDIQPVAHQALRRALVMAPPGTSLEWAGFEQAPTRSRHAVIGPARFSRLDKRTRLVIAPDGVSGISPDGAATVRYADCAVLLTWPDGGRQLIGNDGIGVSVEPTIHRFPAVTLAALDAAISPERTVALPERAAVQIPRATAKTRIVGYRRSCARLRRRMRLFRRLRGPAARRFLRHTWSPLIIVALLVIALLEIGTHTGGQPAVLLLWIALLRGAVLLARWRRRRR